MKALITILFLIFSIYSDVSISGESNCRCVIKTLAEINSSATNLEKIRQLVDSELWLDIVDRKCDFAREKLNVQFENEITSLIQRLKTEESELALVRNISFKIYPALDGALTSELLGVFTNLFYYEPEETTKYLVNNKFSAHAITNIIDPNENKIFGKDKCQLIGEVYKDIESKVWESESNRRLIKKELTDAKKWSCNANN